MNATAMERTDFINEERVVCANCQYQFSYVYGGHEERAPDTPGVLLNTSEQEFVRTRCERYADLWEAYERCPHCGYLQDWMIRIRRRLLTRLVAGCAIGVAVILLVSLRYATALDILETGVNTDAFATLIGLFAFGVGYSIVHRHWKPNRYVDVDGYGGATRVESSEPPPVWNPNVCLALIPHPNPYRQRRIRIALAGAGVFVLGLASFLLPLVSDGVAYELQNRGIVMLPFFLGVALMMGSGLGLPLVYATKRISEMRAKRSRERVVVEVDSRGTTRVLKAKPGGDGDRRREVHPVGTKRFEQT